VIESAMLKWKLARISTDKLDRSGRSLAREIENITVDVEAGHHDSCCVKSTGEPASAASDV
jgi:hypothetical protein